MSASIGPGSPFTCLLDAADDEGPALPQEIQEVYGASWRLPAPAGRPYVYSNFVVARDGRVSFDQPGHSSGADVSGFDRHDRWLMGLLRARADAILMGDNTLRVEPDHVWSAQFIWPDDADVFAALRVDEGRAPMPLQVFLSLDCDIDVAAAAVFAHEPARIVIATTARGAERARTLGLDGRRVDVIELGVEAVDPAALLARLRRDYGVDTVLCEGGPRAYGSLLAAGCVDDEFLALSPTVIGSAPETPRPSLVEGVAFTHDRHPRSVPLTVHRAGDMLFLRSRYAYPV